MCHVSSSVVGPDWAMCPGSQLDYRHITYHEFCDVVVSEWANTEQADVDMPGIDKM